MIKAGNKAMDQVVAMARESLNSCKTTPKHHPEEFGLTVGEVEMCMRCVLELAWGED